MQSRRPPVRTIKRVVDVDARRTITSDELLAMPLDDYQHLRRAATLRSQADNPRFFCEACGYPVYARTYITGPGWRHFKGAPPACPWSTGTPSDIDDVSRMQFHGQQESPLHHRVKYLIADILSRDSRVTDIAVDQHLMTEEGSRRPDVRATFLNRPLALELQLSTTQLPIILQRETFYTRHQRHLIWLTWAFEPQPLSTVRQAFKDIRTSHSGNLFSLDPEVIAEGERRGTLAFRAFWWKDGVCRSRLATLDDLHWPQSGLCYVVAPPHLELRRRWAELDPESRNFYPERRALYDQIARASGIAAQTGDDDDEAIMPLIDLLMSFSEGRPVGTKQNNLIEITNTFLNTQARRKYAGIARLAADCSGRGDLFQKSSVQKKFDQALLVPQTYRDTVEAKLIRFLFPEWGMTGATSATTEHAAPTSITRNAEREQQPT